MHLNTAMRRKLLIVFVCLAMHIRCGPETVGKVKENMSKSILDATESELATGQAKITYRGPQLKPIPTVAFTASGHSLQLNQFIVVQQLHEAYPNDETPYIKQFSVEPTEFRRILSGVKPVLIALIPKKGPDFLSFTVTHETGGRIVGQEFHIDRSAGSEFYEELLDALEPADEIGRALIQKQFQAVYPK
jgi:hypothetical protein